MLNKLLQRCMPWMDKGRWYKLTLVKSGSNYVVDPKKSDDEMSDSFYNIAASGAFLYIEFKLPDAGFIVKSVKFKILTSSVFVYAVSAHSCSLEKVSDLVDTFIVCPESGRLIQNVQGSGDEFVIYLYAERVIL